MTANPVFTARALRVRLLPQPAVRSWPLWAESFSGSVKDHRYHELVADTLGFDCRVLVVEDESGTPLALQPCFFTEQDLVAAAPAPLRALVRHARRWWPGLLRLRMLMIGCAAGEGEITAEPHLKILRDALPGLAREHGAALVVWKDVPAHYRGAMEVVRSRFARIASMPAATLALGFASFDDYLARALSHASRKNLRRKFRHAAGAAPLAMSVVAQLDGCLTEAHGLYLQVFARSKLQFEKLTVPFLIGLQERFGDEARFFLWRQDGRLVAVSICLVRDGILYDEYLGLDYRVALDLHLYFATFRDVLTWALAHGIHTYHSTPLNYDPKLHLGMSLKPLDLYVAPAAGWFFPLLKLAIPFIEPTQAEPVLRMFDNFPELRG